jgi:hypothetical protein
VTDREMIRRILRAINDGRATNLRFDDNPFSRHDWLFDLPGGITVRLSHHDAVHIRPVPSGCDNPCIGLNRLHRRITKALERKGMTLDPATDADRIWEAL